MHHSASSRFLRLCLLLLLVGQQCWAASNETVHHEEEESEPGAAVLFPWFAVVIGVCLFFFLTRYAQWFPYTAACFLVGTAMGISATSLDNQNHLLHESLVDWWISIDSEVLLLVFLPGLVFKDAASLNVHLFKVAFGQCCLFAFPMVLAGTCLTALVAFYVFPYDWSFPFCLTIGSILAATDPVAVSALLEEVGAPPRLKLHIAGESLLNDGSAIVFYSLFSLMFLTELNVDDLGENVSFGRGVAIFFRMSLGGACVGVAFGIGLLVLMRLLDRRLNREENVVQVAATVGTAYLCYFTADVAWKTSGVIATVAMGVVIGTFGHASVNDVKLLEDFWHLTEYLLNSVLFTLGGLVWGGIIANSDEESPHREFTGTDWGYLVVLYLCVTVIRFLLFGLFYPLYSRIGLKSSWQEMVFQSYGGLRGAVGIALAISLDAIVRRVTVNEELDAKYEEQTTKLFGFVGGIALLTLVVNATSAGPMLRKLGLADTSDIREKILECFHDHWRQVILEDMVTMLTEKRFKHVNFAVIRDHVPVLGDLTRDELLDAAEKYRHANEHKADYRSPKLDNVLSYLKSEGDDKNALETGNENITKVKATQRKNPVLSKVKEMDVVELRRLFLELIRFEYEHMIQNGELSSREFVAMTLFSSVDFASEKVQQGERLADFESLADMHSSLVAITNYINIHPVIRRAAGFVLGPSCNVEVSFAAMRTDVERCVAFINAHKKSGDIFRKQFMNDDDLSGAEKRVFEESRVQIKLAGQVLDSYPSKDVDSVVSHIFCSILLNNGARHVEEWVASGLLKAQEADVFLEEIQEELLSLNTCELRTHEGELPMNQSFHGGSSHAHGHRHSFLSRLSSSFIDDSGTSKTTTNKTSLEDIHEHDDEQGNSSIPL